VPKKTPGDRKDPGNGQQKEFERQGMSELHCVLRQQIDGECVPSAASRKSASFRREGRCFSLSGRQLGMNGPVHDARMHAIHA